MERTELFDKVLTELASAGSNGFTDIPAWCEQQELKVSELMVDSVIKELINKNWASANHAGDLMITYEGEQAAKLLA